MPFSLSKSCVVLMSEGSSASSFSSFLVEPRGRHSDQLIGYIKTMEGSKLCAHA